MRTIVNRLSQSDSAEAWKQVMSVSYSRSADCICLAYYNALTEVLPVPASFILDGFPSNLSSGRLSIRTCVKNVLLF